MSRYKPNKSEPVDTSCPTPEMVLSSYLMQSDVRVPKMFPSDPFQAARYWMAHQRPKDDYRESAVPPTTRGTGWDTPYHDRLLRTLKAFVRLKSVYQAYIIENIEKGVEWRGDDIKLYTLFVESAEKLKTSGLDRKAVMKEVARQARSMCKP